MTPIPIARWCVVHESLATDGDDPTCDHVALLVDGSWDGTISVCQLVGLVPANKVAALEAAGDALADLLSLWMQDDWLNTNEQRALDAWREARR